MDDNPDSILDASLRFISYLSLSLSYSEMYMPR